MCTARLRCPHPVPRFTEGTSRFRHPVVAAETDPIESPRCARRTDESTFRAAGQTRGTGVNDFGSGHPSGASGSWGGGAPEIPPLGPNPARTPARTPATYPSRPTPFSSAAGGPDRVSDPIPFRLPGDPGSPEELHAADPPVDEAAPELKLGPTGRPMPDLPEPR